MDKKIKTKKEEFVFDLDDQESIKILIIDTRVKYNFSLFQALVFLARIIEKESKKTFSDEEMEKITYYLLDKAGLYNFET
jgi:hypothetical protein